jgi:hypothetical protein
MRSGYCFELDGCSAAGWQLAPDDDWPIVVYTPKGDELRVGTRLIDGSVCVVFLCSDNVYRAQTRVAVGK